MQIRERYIPWRDRAFVSVAEAAAILARSEDWIRDRAAEGRLDGRRLVRGGPLVVTAASISKLAGEAQPSRKPTDLPPEPVSVLRLVVSNPPRPEHAS